MQQTPMYEVETMPDLSRPERLQVMLSDAELNALDDWRFAKRMPSRAAAIRELLRLGLATQGIDLASAGQHSSSFGVLETTSAGSSGSKRRVSRRGNGAA